MGFLLEKDDETAAPPWPHVRCVGAADGEGRGWAWHDDPRRQACFSSKSVLGETIVVATRAPLIAAAIDGRTLPGIDRLLAIVQLQVESPGSLVRIFRHECSVCGADHKRRVDRLLVAASLIHEGAYAALRDARVSERRLREPEIRPVPHGSPQKSRVRLGNIPAWPHDPARNRLAQIAYAQQYRLISGFAHTF